MRDQAQIVIIGAGIAGCSLAYHLAKLGRTDVLVIDQGPLFRTGGSTSHAPGGMFQTNASRMMSAFAHYTCHLFADVTLDGVAPASLVGGIELAETQERWHDLKRKRGLARSWGLEAELLSPAECQAKIPILDPRQVLGGFFVPDDGVIRPAKGAEALARIAIAAGVGFEGGVKVTGIETRAGRVSAVLTDRGRIATEAVVCCAGIWGPRLGAMVGEAIPLQPMEHQYALTESLDELKPHAPPGAQATIPMLRAQDHALYFRQDTDQWGIGNYRHAPLPVDPWDILDHGQAPVMPSLTRFTPEHFADAHRRAQALFPATRGKALTSCINGMFSFTPDGLPLMGESLTTPGFWVCEAVWITHAGGVGKAMAERMVAGESEWDIHEADLHRFAPHQMTGRFVRRRGIQQYVEVYDIIHPMQPMEEPRLLRRSPVHARLEALGGRFFESAGWERPHWFEANATLLDGLDVPARDEWSARFWSPIQGAEHRATREGAALFDLSPFTKAEISGPGALAFLQRLAAGNIDRPVGKVVYTALLTQRGGFAADLTITRIGADRFLLVTGGAVGRHDLAWVRRWMPRDGSVQLVDVTSSQVALGLWGPKARAVLETVADIDVSNAAFPYFNARDFAIGYVPVRALRLSYAGELGWEIYAPAEFGLALWDTLWEAGREHGLTAAGIGAFDSLRLEKGFRLWGADIDPERTPLEAGLDWAVAAKKPDFIGRDAVLRQKAEGPARKLCCLTLDAPEAVLMGKEPILAEGRVVGYVTSANRGHTVGRFIAYGYLPAALAQPGTKLTIEYFDRPLAATVAAEPIYDPAGVRMRA